MQIIPYDDYNSRIPPQELVGYVGAITTTFGHSALRNGWKIIEVNDDIHSRSIPTDKTSST